MCAPNYITAGYPMTSAAFYENELKQHEGELNLGIISFKLGNLFIVAGGILKENIDNGNLQATTDSCVYNLDTNEWKGGPKLPYPLYSGSALTNKSKSTVVIIEGYTKDNKTHNSAIMFEKQMGFFQLKNLKPNLGEHHYC